MTHPTEPGAPSQRSFERHHFVMMFVIWAVLSIAADLVLWFVAGPHVPPGTMTSSAGGQQFDFNVLIMMAVPVILAVWVYGGYCLWAWRASRGGPEPVAGATRGAILACRSGGFPPPPPSLWGCSFLAPTNLPRRPEQAAVRGRTRCGRPRRIRSCRSRSLASSGRSLTATRPSAVSRLQTWSSRRTHGSPSM